MHCASARPASLQSFTYLPDINKVRVQHVNKFRLFRNKSENHKEYISYDHNTLPKLWSVDRTLKLPAKSWFINSSNCDESIVGSLSDLRFKEI